MPHDGQAYRDETAMRRVRSRLLSGFLVAIYLSVSAASVADLWRVTFDSDTTRVRFVLDATLHSVHGTATLLPAELTVGPDQGELHGDLIVDARTAETGNVRRDRVMHRKVLESERYPGIMMSLSSFDGDLAMEGASRVRVLGDIEIHGSRHPVELDVDVSILGDEIQLTTRFMVPYVEWGMKDPSKLVLRVAKQVSVEVEAAGTISRNLE